MRGQEIKKMRTYLGYSLNTFSDFLEVDQKKLKRIEKMDILLNPDKHRELMEAMVRVLPILMVGRMKALEKVVNDIQEGDKKIAQMAKWLTHAKDNRSTTETTDEE